MENPTASRLAEISQWIDDANAHRDPEAITWGRLAKVSEECGELIEAYIGCTGQNPRKGVTHNLEDVKKELLDIAFTALAAYEHLTGNFGGSLGAFVEHTIFLHKRAQL